MAASNSLIDELVKRVEGYRDSMIEFQKELTSQIALSPENGGRGEWQRADFLVEKIKSFGFDDITGYHAADDRVDEGTRPNFVVRQKGVSSEPTIWVLAHMDVVPAGDRTQWMHDPFEAHVKEGKIYARGTEDNQQGLICALYAMRALKEQGLTPKNDICLLLVSDEESGSTYGIEYVLESKPDLIKPNDIVIVPDSGTQDGSQIEIAEKSILWCKFDIRGKQVHASTPQNGINAHRAACHLAVRLDNKLMMSYAYRDELFDPPQSTFELTKREANVPNVNTIPGEDVFWMDCRILPEYDLEDVKASIEAIASSIENEFHVKVAISYPQAAQAATPTPQDAPVVKVLSKAIETVTGIEPSTIGIGGGTVAAVFRKRNIPVAVWSTIDDTAHSVNEYCVIDNLVQDTKIFAGLFAEGTDPND